MIYLYIIAPKAGINHKQFTLYITK